MQANEAFFQRWQDADELQARYEARIIELTKEMKKDHGANYRPVYQDQIIKEISRGEIVVEHYEFMVANDMESSPNVGFLLKNERQQLNKNRSMLQLDVKSIRTAKEKTAEKGDHTSDSAKESLMKMLEQAQEDGDLNLDLPEELEDDDTNVELVEEEADEW